MANLLRRRFLGLAGAAALAAGAGRRAWAQTYPERSVRFIVPFAAGGSTDVIARLVAANVSQILGKQCYVENIAGGSGNVGMEQAARATPDGYTVLTADSSFVIKPSLFANLPYDAIKDFDPVSLGVTSTSVIAVNPDLKASDIKELVALIRANPGKYSFASAGTGTVSHLAGIQFRQAFDLDLVHVPFGGSGPAMESVVGGFTPMGFGTPNVVASLVNAGKLRALAVLSKARVDSLPQVPTLIEGGYPDIDGDNIVGFLVPAGTPKDAIATLNGAIVATLAAPGMKERLAMFADVPAGDTPEEFGARIKSEIAFWGKVVQAANITPQ